jgi:hypothetical protein
MQGKILVATLAVATALMPVSVATASPLGAEADNGRRVASGTQLLLTFDHGESLRPGTRVRDDSGHGHAGTVVVQAGGTIKRTQGLVRRGADFPGRCGGCGRAVIDVADARRLDPRLKAFIFGVAIKVSPREGTRSSNLVQKGFFRQEGGQFKLQLTSAGEPSCVVFGSEGRVRVTADRDITNNRWHRLSCSRVDNRVIVRIDGRIRARETGATGVIRNSAPVRTGAKKVNPANQQFHGDLDSVFVRMLAG